VARSCVEHCGDAAAMRRTITVALIVGTLLTLINQGDRIAAGEVDLAVAMKVLANYLIPWCVSSIGYISARRPAAPPVDQPLDAPPAREPEAADRDGPSRVDASR
jgi:hypothetical protein